MGNLIHNWPCCKDCLHNYPSCYSQPCDCCTKENGYQNFVDMNDEEAVHKEVFG